MRWVRSDMDAQSLRSRAGCASLMSIVVACGSPPAQRAPATPAEAVVTSFSQVSLGTVPDGTGFVFARGQPGAFVAVSDAADGVVVVRTDRDDQVRVEGARSPALALSDTDVALAYVATGDGPRLALFDSALGQLRTIDLGVDVKAGHTRGQLVLVAWNPRQMEWAVAWLGVERLSAKEIRELRAEGEMIPLDGTMQRVQVARIARDGALVATNRIDVDSTAGVTLLALEPHGHGYAVLTRAPSGELSCGGAPAHDEIRLTVVATGAAAAASAAHRVLRQCGGGGFATRRPSRSCRRIRRGGLHVPVGRRRAGRAAVARVRSVGATHDHAGDVDQREAQRVRRSVARWTPLASAHPSRRQWR